MPGSAWNPGNIINVDAESSSLSQPFVVSAGQTLLTLTSFTYVPMSGSVQVFRGGQKLVLGRDYNETDQSHVTLLLSDVQEGEVFEVVGVIGSTGANVIVAQQAASLATNEANRAAAAAASLTIPTGFAMVLKTTDTGSLVKPAGTTAQRDAAPQIGYSRFNTELGADETWNGTAWVPSGGGATGGGSDKTFWENGNTITADHTVKAGINAGSFGPMIINSGVTVTVEAGAVWTIV